MNTDGTISPKSVAESLSTTSPWDATAVSARVLDLARELTAVASNLSKIGNVEERAEDERPLLLLLLKSIVKTRRLRNRLVSADLFADPAWDMLLDLTISRLEDTPVAVSSLCIAANVPATTALRWIGRLLEEGIVYRTMDPADRRRNFIYLSDQMYDKMIAFAKAIRPSY